MDDLTTVITENRLVGLWRLIKGHSFLYLIASISLGISTLARTGMYLWLRQFLDKILPGGPSTSMLLLVGLGFVGLAVLQGAFTFISGALAARTAENTTRRLRNFLFDHLQRLTFTYHDKTPTGELISRSTSDVDALRRLFADQVIGAGRILLLFGVNLAVMMSIDVGLALRSIIVIPFIVLLSVFFFRRVSKAYEAYQEQEAVLSTTLQENLSAIRVVKAFARQPFEREKFERENWQKFMRGRSLMTMHSLYWPSSDILSGFQMLAGLYMAARMTIEGTITIGSYVAYAGMLVWIIWPMRNLGRLIVQMSMGLVSFDRVKEVIKQTREPMEIGFEPPGGDLEGDVVFDEVGFSYEESEQVLRGVTFHSEPGRIIALLGPTGSGKTSLVNLIPRFYEYTSGHVYLDGVELNTYSRSYLRSQIGIVEQEPFLFSRSIRDNITLGVDREVGDQEVIDAAQAAAIHADIESFPEGYETLVGERGVTLSGGQKQRIAIARALLKDPCILILDDSTSSVDMLTEADIRRALDNLMANRTTFIIAHRIQSVMNADQILVLDGGEIVQRGKHDELVMQDGLYRRIYEMQTNMEIALEKELSDGLH
ncbi:MAG: ABC transporter ATP-binding protein [Anaerolineales bacterium]|nr:ABC transporter ATP-binding protein [Anaerolineales bacterium]